MHILQASRIHSLFWRARARAYERGDAQHAHHGRPPWLFRPNPRAFVSPHAPLGSERASYYSVDPLAKNLRDLIDFDRINSGSERLTVGACDVQSGEMRYFDSREQPLSLRHVLASGAVPPAFPAVRIDGRLYWDGGILSNTPVEAVPPAAFLSKRRSPWIEIARPTTRCARVAFAS